MYDCQTFSIVFVKVCPTYCVMMNGGTNHFLKGDNIFQRHPMATFLSPTQHYRLLDFWYSEISDVIINTSIFTNAQGSTARDFCNIICEILRIHFLCVNWCVMLYHCLIFLHLRNHTKFIVAYSNVSICQRSFQMNPGFIFFLFPSFCVNKGDAYRNNSAKCVHNEHKISDSSAPSAKA